MDTNPFSDIEIGDERDRKSWRGYRLTTRSRKRRFTGARQAILIHGYNSSRDSCADSYDLLLGNLRVVAPRLERSTLTLSWPGHTQYAKAVRRATRDVADQLATFLESRSRNTSTELVLVGHSLGCRLILEALSRLAPSARQLLDRTKIVLMAAAVPTRVLGPGRPLRTTVEACARADVFFSLFDEALAPAFPLVQIREQGGLTQAVGWLGGPADLWSAQHNMTPCSHSGYWGDEDVAYRIASAVGAAEHRPIGRHDLARRGQATRGLSRWGARARSTSS